MIKCSDRAYWVATEVYKRACKGFPSLRNQRVCFKWVPHWPPLTYLSQTSSHQEGYMLSKPSITQMFIESSLCDLSSNDLWHSTFIFFFSSNHTRSRLSFSSAIKQRDATFLMHVIPSMPPPLLPQLLFDLHSAVLIRSWIEVAWTTMIRWLKT